MLSFTFIRLEMVSRAYCPLVHPVNRPVIYLTPPYTLKLFYSYRILEDPSTLLTTWSLLSLSLSVKEVLVIRDP